MSREQDAVDLLQEVITALNRLPCTWEEFLGEELADRVHAMLDDEDTTDEDFADHYDDRDDSDDEDVSE